VVHHGTLTEDEGRSEPGRRVEERNGTRSGVTSTSDVDEPDSTQQSSGDDVSHTSAAKTCCD